MMKYGEARAATGARQRTPGCYPKHSRGPRLPLFFSPIVFGVPIRTGLPEDRKQNVKKIVTARKALRQATRTRRRRPWVWGVMVIGANLGLSVSIVLSIVLMAEQRVAEIERRVEERIELQMEGRGAWRGELATARNELGTEVAELRSELTELRREVSANDGGLRGGLDALGGRVTRIESMVTILWRMPGSGAQASLN